MGINWEEIGDFEVATAEFAQSKFMNQVVVKVDADTDLASLPTEVKTAYVLATGITYARDIANNWKPVGGVAAIGSVAPTNPQTGQIWVDTTDKLPAPVRGTMLAGPLTISNTSYAAISGQTTVSITCTRSIMAAINYTCWLSSAGATGIRSRVLWGGATSGGSVQMACESTGEMRMHSQTEHHILNAGTTTFTAYAFRTNTAASTSIQNVIIEVAPVAWGDLYAAGAS